LRFARQTSIIRQLEIDGFSVIEEAATDVNMLERARGVAEPWKLPSFIDSIAELQRRRQAQAARETGEVQFHDRSAICTAALAVWLGYPFSDALSRELTRLETKAIFQKRVFFIHSLGLVTPTEARRISFDEALRFERAHEETYRKFGFEIVSIAPGSLSEAPPGSRSTSLRPSGPRGIRYPARFASTHRTPRRIAGAARCRTSLARHRAGCGGGGRYVVRASHGRDSIRRSRHRAIGPCAAVMEAYMPRKSITQLYAELEEVLAAADAIKPASKEKEEEFDAAVRIADELCLRISKRQ
jgi:predicted ATPase